jgi:peroxiredoxin
MGRWIDGERQRDTAVITNGTFGFTGSVENPDLYHIRIPGDHIPIDFALENAKIKVRIAADGSRVVSGTAYNDAFQNYLDAERMLRQRLKERVEARQAHLPESERSSTYNREESSYFNEQMQNIFSDFVLNNPDNPSAWSLSVFYSWYLTLEKQQEFVAKASARTLEIPEIIDFVKYVEAQENTAVGQRFTDFRMPGPDGKEIALSDFAGKGKYVMIDFTATWCAPCRAGKPAMIATYNKFKNRGFEIVGVWFDRNHNDWIKGMKELNMPPWPQMSELKSWHGEGARQYGVRAVPLSILIDPDGIIIARGLRGEELDAKLTELLSKK